MFSSRKRLILVISLAFLLSFTLAAYMVKIEYKSQKSLYVSEKLEDSRMAYRVITGELQKRAELIFEAYINKPEILKIMVRANAPDKKTRDAARRELLEKLTPIYHRMKSLRVLRIQFHLPNCESFLRLYSPQKYGDNLGDMRYSVKETNAKFVEVHGFEGGRTFDGFRNVFPLIYGDRHLGSVEISMPTELVVRNMAQLFHKNYTFIIKKNIVRSKLFQDELSRYKQSDIDSDYYYLKEYIPDPQLHSLFLKLHPIIREKLKRGTSLTEYTGMDEKYFLTLFLPIVNTHARQVAYVVSTSEDHTIHKLFLSHLSTFILAAISLFSILILFYYLAEKNLSLRKTQIELEKAAEVLQKHIDYNPAAIVIHKEGKIAYANDAAVKLLGAKDKEALLNKPIIDFVHPDFREIVAERIQKIQTENFHVPAIEEKLVGFDGRVIDAEVVGIKTNYKGSDAIEAVFWDVTRRKQAEAEAERLATVVEQASQTIMVTDIRGDILYANPAFEKITGYTLEEVRGDNPRILKSGKHDKKFYKDIWDTISSGKTWEGTFVNKKKNGELYHERAVIFPIKNKTGKIINYAAVKQDISNEKRLEEQFLQSQKMEAVGVLAGGVAHDFNNLLNIINGYSELALLRMKEGDPGYNELSSILSAGKKAGDLVSKLMAFSRKQTYVPEAIDVNRVISEMDKMLRRLIPEDISIETNLAPDIPLIMSDPGQIEQILVNLVVNARDAIAAKSDRASEKKITIDTRKTFLDASYTATHYGTKEGLYVVISVSDSGIGMDEETKSKVFDPFFTTKEKGKGTGLGLSTVFGIVKQNEGNIIAYSEPQKGTTFKIYWPASEKGTVSGDAGTAYPGIKKGNETLLFVEDVSELRELAVNALRGFGYTVMEASNGLEALELIKKQKGGFDLLITDLIMPSMNGDELAKEAKKVAPDIKIIFSSGYTDNHVVHSGMLEKDVEFLQKPYSLSVLTRKIRDVLDRNPDS